MMNRPSVSWLTSSAKRWSTVKWTLPAPQTEPIFQVTTGRLLSPPAAVAFRFAVSMMPLSADAQPDSSTAGSSSAMVRNSAKNLFFISLSPWSFLISHRCRGKSLSSGDRLLSVGRRAVFKKRPLFRRGARENIFHKLGRPYSGGGHQKSPLFSESRLCLTGGSSPRLRSCPRRRLRDTGDIHKKDAMCLMLTTSASSG